ncbi:MAG: cation transporter [Candidatus Malihini olakiniferum]
MDCPSCAKKIKNAIIPLPSLIQTSVRFAIEKLIVDAQSDIRIQIQRAVEHAGFTWQDTSPTSTAQIIRPCRTPPLRRILREQGFLILFAVLTAASGVLSLFCHALQRLPLS